MWRLHHHAIATAAGSHHPSVMLHVVKIATCSVWIADMNLPGVKNSLLLFPQNSKDLPLFNLNLVWQTNPNRFTSWGNKQDCVVGYAFSPIDLIPDPIPILGYFDDLILIPLGVVITLRMIPEEVMTECREHSQEIMLKGKPVNWISAIVIIGIWILFAAIVIGFMLNYF